jgi:hypothetical protein
MYPQHLESDVGKHCIKTVKVCVETTEITIQVDLINSMDIKPIRYILLHSVIDTVGRWGGPYQTGQGAFTRFLFFSFALFERVTGIHLFYIVRWKSSRLLSLQA